MDLCAVETSGGTVWIPYELRRSRRARHMRLTLGAENQAVLTVPARVAEAEAVAFLRSQGDWLEEQLAAAAGRRRPRLSEHLRRRPWLSAAGGKVATRVDFASGQGRLRYEPEAARADLSLDPASDADRQLAGLLRAFAKRVVPAHVREIARRHRVATGRVTVRDQSTLWGSCSGRSNLSFNWRIVLLPPALHDYLIHHELAHLTEFNHSPAFWALLEAYDPGSRQHDRRVTELSPELMALGRF